MTGPHPGWIVAALGTAQTLSWASSYYLVAILAAPMARDLGVAAPTVFAAFSGAMIAVPLVLQSYGIFAIAWIGARMLKLPHDIAAPACLIGTSNFFELAVAVAISLFGLDSGAALATVVGVLVEVPVMLSLVAFANRRRGTFADARA